MPTTTTSEIQFDHKQWFHDLDRWNFYLQSWQKQLDELTREYRRLQKMVEQYAEDLDEFSDEVGAHRNRLVADERAMVEHRPTALDQHLAKSHDANAAKHNELYKMHEHLQQTQQALQAGLSLFHREPLRGE
jgi:chromosome segregation ATPase